MNPYHDARGRFAARSGGGGRSVSPQPTAPPTKTNPYHGSARTQAFARAKQRTEGRVSNLKRAAARISATKPMTFSNEYTGFKDPKVARLSKKMYSRGKSLESRLNRLKNLEYRSFMRDMKTYRR